MGSSKSFVKGLAAGAVLGAVAALVSSMKDKDKKASALAKAAEKIKGRVATHAKKLGKLSKSAYAKIVDTTIAEYRGMKALSEQELADLKGELKDSWTDVEKMVKGSKEKK